MNTPLKLPIGSVRAILALILTLVSCALAFLGKLPPESLRDVMLMVIGFYFGARGKEV